MRKLLIPLLLSLFSSVIYANEIQFPSHPITIEQTRPMSEENYEYDFGSIPVQTVVVANFTVTNNTEDTLTFVSGTIAGDYFYGEHNCSAGLKPTEACDVAIYYYPEKTGDHEGAFELSFNPELIIHVDLYGNAY